MIIVILSEFASRVVIKWDWNFVYHFPFSSCVAVEKKRKKIENECEVFEITPLKKQKKNHAVLSFTHFSLKCPR